MRAARRLLLVISLALAAMFGAVALAGCADGPPPIRRAGSVTSTSPVTQSSASPDGQVNDLYPEGRDRAQCGPGVERPGCGSKAKGNWRMKLVFALLAIGLTIIGWRIVAATVRRREVVDPPSGDWVSGPPRR